MAAEALLGAVLEKLLTLIQKEFATLFGIRGKTEKLSNTLAVIRAVLEDAEEQQMTNRSIKAWLRQLKDAVYVLDDILEDCPMQSPQLGCLSSFKPKNIMLRCEVGPKLNEMIERLDQIAQAKNKFVLREGSRERSSEEAEWRQTSSIVTEPHVYGRDEDKEKIVEFFLSSAWDSDRLSIYAIVGLGGVGKTTLAQLVYNDQRVSNHFNLKIWICVYENFTIKRILCSIIESITKEKYNISILDVMVQKVQDLLQSKRYLLVLDDVWKKNQQLEFGLNQEKWNKLKSVLLSCKSKCASILVSTRDMDVAEIMGASKADRLSGISEDDCWSLFKQRAFGPDKEERKELVQIGREIVKKCSGSPLAALALGGLMHSKKGVKEWLEVKESKLWALQDKNEILRALRLSYFHLTPTMKQCFAFCSIFPKDAQIMKEDLIHLWMANGFISSREHLDVEDIGNMIWNELYQISFFQDVKANGGSSDIYFKMPDLVHDLAQSITEQECMCLENANMSDLSRNTHHIGFSYGGRSLPFKKGALEKVESLRTLYQLGSGMALASDCFPTYHSLRVLCICTNSFNLSSLRNLTNLRYLELYKMRIEALPNSICNLLKLEILKLKSIRGLCCLPKHLSCLQNLRHLVIISCDSLAHMFPNIRNLSDLRTLSLYIVNSEIGHSLAELHDLKLGGKLSIDGLNNVGSSSEAQEANLKAKEDLQELYFSWLSKTKSPVTNVEQVLEALQPHSNLKVMAIYGYEGSYFPSWMGNGSVLSNLVSLQFYKCNNCLQLSLLGKLPSLKKLHISVMDYVKYIDDVECYDGVNVRAFPSLEELHVGWLPNLERLLKVEQGDMFPYLSNLSIQFCPNLQWPFLPYVRTLKVSGCNNVTLSSISSFNSLNYLCLYESRDLKSFPKGMMNDLGCLKTLIISNFTILEELPNEITKLKALESLDVRNCHELKSLPEQGLEGLCSLRTLTIYSCIRLRSLPKAVRHLTSLEVLSIEYCPALQKRCKEGTGEDWHKIAHIPKVTLYPSYDEESRMMKTQSFFRSIY